MTGLLLVAVGAAAGAPTRWWVDQQVQRRFAPVLPWGTFVVNVVGSFALGLLFSSGGLSSHAYLAVGVGFLGALTTFSSFAWETHRLAEDRGGADGDGQRGRLGERLPGGGSARMVDRDGAVTWFAGTETPRQANEGPGRWVRGRGGGGR